MPGKSKRAMKAKAAKAGKAAKDKAKAAAIEEEGKLNPKDKDVEGSYRMATGVLWSQPRALDVKIGGFSMTSWGSVLIQDTMIEFSIGRRYGLIGANGCGKSTLLKSLAAREVPIPDHIDIYFLENEVDPEEKTPIEVVVETVKNEMKRLEAQAEDVMEKEGPDAELLEDIYERLDEMEPETFEMRAGVLLHGLGFDEEMIKKNTCDMSGGWRMRVALAQALFVKPALLLLDEPTNHLDMEACIWLAEYLSKYPRCLVTVSHSQDFLDSVCTNIMEITPRLKLQNYKGNYSTYIQTKKENEVNQTKRYRKEQDDIKHIKNFISSCGTFSNLVKQAKSKQKILDKMYEKGLTLPVAKGPAYNFNFAQCEVIPPPIVAFSDVSFAYDGKMTSALYHHVAVGVDCDSRIAIVGPNGAGKSTLLKLILGEITPIVGSVKRHSHLSIGRYHQHSMDVLEPDLSPLDFMAKTFPEMKWDITQWRQQIGRFGIGGNNQSNAIKTLSDGLKSRIIFAMIATKNPNLLLLDEPTNHLDMECIDALAGAINSYNGGLVLVSHDFRLIDQVAKEIWVVDDKKVDRWKGTIREYKEKLIKGMNTNV